MNRSKHVRMLIAPDGTCSIDALNFTDSTCTKATQEITRALAGEMIRDRLKPEGRVAQRDSAQHPEAAR